MSQYFVTFLIARGSQLVQLSLVNVYVDFTDYMDVDRTKVSRTEKIQSEPVLVRSKQSE